MKSIQFGLLFFIDYFGSLIFKINSFFLKKYVFFDNLKSLIDNFELLQNEISYNLNWRTKINWFKKLENQIESKKLI